MGLLISINGADFEPYHNVHSPPPLVKEIDRSHNVKPVRRETDSHDSFSEALEKSVKKGHKIYSEAKQESRSQAKSATTARDLMSSPVVTLDPQDMLQTARQLFHEKQIRHLPVTDTDDKILGIISDRDLAINEGEHILSAIMKKKIIAAQLSTPLQEIARAMIDQKISSVPVLDAERKVIGIVTSTDLLESVFKNPSINFWA